MLDPSEGNSESDGNGSLEQMVELRSKKGLSSISLPPTFQTAS